MNTKRIGNITEAVILSEFVKLGVPVLMPFGDNERYDMVIHVGEKFLRIQCKTGRIRKKCVIFNACSNQTANINTSQSYIGQIDFFAVYCAENNKCYLTPVLTSTQIILRIENPLNHQKTKINYAVDYELEKVLKTIQK